MLLGLSPLGSPSPPSSSRGQVPGLCTPWLTVKQKQHPNIIRHQTIHITQLYVCIPQPPFPTWQNWDLTSRGFNTSMYIRLQERCKITGLAPNMIELPIIWANIPTHLYFQRYMPSVSRNKGQMTNVRNVERHLYFVKTTRISPTSFWA